MAKVNDKMVAARETWEKDAFQSRWSSQISSQKKMNNFSKKTVYISER
jgi:hypothetical protein